MKNLCEYLYLKNQVNAKDWLHLISTALILILLSNYSWANEATADKSGAKMVVYKTPQCGCCDKWVEHLEENNFNVTVNVVTETQSIRNLFGVPHALASCHTAIVGEYWVEGHVPADLIEQLLAEQPEHIKGISTPGMPQGSPGMESPNPVRYQVISVDDQGNTEVYATRDGLHAH